MKWREVVRSGVHFVAENILSPKNNSFERDKKVYSQTVFASFARSAIKIR